jgi:hypothetical protein
VYGNDVNKLIKRDLEGAIINSSKRLENNGVDPAVLNKLYEEIESLKNVSAPEARKSYDSIMNKYTDEAIANKLNANEAIANKLNENEAIANKLNENEAIANKLNENEAIANKNKKNKVTYDDDLLSKAIIYGSGTGLLAGVGLAVNNHYNKRKN